MNKQYLPNCFDNFSEDVDVVTYSFLLLHYVNFLDPLPSSSVKQLMDNPQ